MNIGVVVKRIFTLICLSLAGVLAAVAQPGTQAAPPAASAPAHVPNKVGVIAAQTALLSTKDGQRALQDLNKKIEPTKVAIEKKANEIRELQDKLQRGGNAMADAAKAELQRAISEKTKAYNRDMEDAQAEAEQEQHHLLDELTAKMQKVIENYAQTNGFSIILDDANPNTPVLYVSNSVEITKEVIDLYDKTYPVTASGPAPAASKPALPKPPASTLPSTTPKKQP
jgi:outer membrane protein